MERAKAAAAARRGSDSSQKAGPQDADKKNPSATDKPGDEAGQGAPPPLTRPAEPPRAPDPAELNVKPDADGLVSFQFRNQPWPEVLRWYSAICNLSFDWQELPGDYINLATQHRHTLEETGDMINRALLMRGFTMLRNNETLTVAKTEGLNPALVPRVKPADLSSLPPHKYVRTSFALNWLLAEEVHQEFASMISPNGKLTPLQSTNRLEAMDAAANLRDIHDILEQEQSALALENLAREFVLKYARAMAVKEQLEVFLGIENPSVGGFSGGSSSNSARMMQAQMQQMQQQMQRQMQQAAAQARSRGGQPGGPQAAGRKRPEDVYLVANERSNSVIVHAQPDKMAIIESFIARVDVPNAISMDFQRLNTRMKVFRLASLGPSELVQTLTAMDVLEPTTRLQVDEDNNAIIAYASVADQYLIKSVIERLDGSERSFQVVQLRRLDAESVAGSIKFLMGTEEEEDDRNSRSRYFGYYPYYGSRDRQSNQDRDKMRVGANVQDNQLLLWVNEVELEEVKNLLVKLGELPPEGGRGSTIRVIDASRQPETYEYLKKLKEQWDKVAPNQLIIPDASEFETESKPVEEEPSTDAESESTAPEIQLDEDIITEAASHPSNSEGMLVSSPAQANEQTTSGTGTRVDQVNAGQTRAEQTLAGQPLAEQSRTDQTGTSKSNLEEAQRSAAEPPPVRIFLDEGGNIVLSSEDPVALDRLEQIMQSNRPPQRPYDVFKVKHAPASWVALMLEDYFDEKEDDRRPRFFSFFLDDSSNRDEDRQLGDRPPLRFLADSDTNSIVVQGADDLDRKTIQELIDLWDVPTPVDTESIRFTRLVRIKYSRAESIVNTLKEAYRDLLSAGDKAFQQNKDEDENRREDSGSTVQGGGLGFGGFKGKLSFGPDKVTNSILVVAEGEALLELMCEMIEKLDEAAKPEGSVQVYQVESGVNGESLAKALRAMFSTAAQQQQPQPGNGRQPNQPGQPGQTNQPNATFNTGDGGAFRARRNPR